MHVLTSLLIVALLFLNALTLSLNSVQQPLGSSHDVTSIPDDDVHNAAVNPLEEFRHALDTMQTRFFELWLGTWPEAIDWTAAVTSTHISAALYTLSRSLEYTIPGASGQTLEAQKVENEINRYFSQLTTYYFGENSFAIRLQAYDDMLWVVLGWLENLKFAYKHNKDHFQRAQDHGSDGAWHGKQFESLFAHRARIFWDLASQGWDTKLCGGGMLWNSRLTPYKNAITNELFIAASTQMYLYFPGDDNDSPFMGMEDFPWPDRAKPHDRKYLRAAIDGYEWLRSSNMLDAQGLYTDGFHIHDWGRNGTIGTGKCDERNEMVYTYNQGVILTGLRGLWESTDDISYLEDGHKLIRSVLAATGWLSGAPSGSLRWQGLGRNGILEEACDWRGNCNQDGQTFKGIFFHHLTVFCELLPKVPLIPGKTYAATPVQAALHLQSCKSYAPWVIHNANAALRTRNEHGEFGMWWGWGIEYDDSRLDLEEPWLPDGAVDYRNEGVPDDGVWSSPEMQEIESDEDSTASPYPSDTNRGILTAAMRGWSRRPMSAVDAKDINDRGRGRTVETQSGGVAVLRAMHEFVNLYAYG